MWNALPVNKTWFANFLLPYWNIQSKVFTAFRPAEAVDNRPLFFFFSRAVYYLEQIKNNALRNVNNGRQYDLQTFLPCLIIYLKSANRSKCSAAVNLWFIKSPFCFPSILLPRGIGSMWNPIMLKPKDPFYPLRYHLSGLIQGFGSYLKTTKGCQAQYFKDRQL